MGNVTKVLVANRGEIAIRVLRACRELGIETVAVFSEADRNALHVRYADQAICIGPPPSRESYLVADKILAAAHQTGADAIHPGYGFLSERAFFSQACEDHGITFIGPHPHAITTMGDKMTARATVAAAGVPVVPGTHPDEDLSDASLVHMGERIGVPLLVKASAGGGGKGMRIVNTLEELPAAIQSARREAEAAFGDGRVYLEKLITNARHIEIQVLADEHGNVIHLGERECSIQRRHQKLLEESPSVFIGEDEELRQRMGEIACQAARSVGYVNAGTVEFLVDRDKNFYFLEMNTRLQVEHPVTELVTGVDIVKEQIRIARGRKLNYTQDQIQMKGWAIEARINAEDPFHNFIPSIGTLTTHLLPSGPGVRVDTAMYQGYTIPPFYDSLISKLICFGETRAQAILRLRRALQEYRITGVQTTIPFHQSLVETHRFQAGNFHTRYIEESFQLNNPEQSHPEIAAVLATIVAHRRSQQAANIVRRPARDTSNWKWISRFERIHR